MTGSGLTDTAHPFSEWVLQCRLSREPQRRRRELRLRRALAMVAALLMLAGLVLLAGPGASAQQTGPEADTELER